MLTIASPGLSGKSTTCATLSLFILLTAPGSFGQQTQGRIPQFNPPPSLTDSALFQKSVVSTSDINSDASVFIKGPGPWIDVTRYGAVADGSDSTNAINAAIAACPSTGCTVFFPYGTPSGSTTPNYFISGSITVGATTVQDGVRLVGECTPLGTGSRRTGTGNPPAPLTCSTITASKVGLEMLVVGQSGVKTHGFARP